MLYRGVSMVNHSIPWFTMIYHGIPYQPWLTMVHLPWYDRDRTMVYHTMVNDGTPITPWCYHGIPWCTMVDHGTTAMCYDMVVPWFTTVYHGIPYNGFGKPWYDHVVTHHGRMVNHGTPWCYHGVPWCGWYDRHVLRHGRTMVYHGRHIMVCHGIPW